jgi:hypothetical protein
LIVSAKITLMVYENGDIECEHDVEYTRDRDGIHTASGTYKAREQMTRVCPHGQEAIAVDQVSTNQ